MLQGQGDCRGRSVASTPKKLPKILEKKTGVLVTSCLMESSDTGDAAVSARDAGEQVHILRARAFLQREQNFPCC